MIVKAFVSVYLGDNILIIPNISDETGLRRSQYQDKIYSYTMSNTEFGKEILSKLEYSENSKCKNSKKHFWTITGIKSYSTFGKKYKLIENNNKNLKRQKASLIAFVIIFSIIFLIVGLFLVLTKVLKNNAGMTKLLTNMKLTGFEQ